MTTENSDTTPASQMITQVKTTVIHRLRQLARRNQRIIVATQYLVGASTFFLPLRAANYELYTEASYSLSQLIAFFNNILLNQDESNSNNVDVQYILWFVTRTVCHLEVFLEKFSLVFWGEQAKTLFVLVIELAKAISRLILLLRRRGDASSGANSPTMLLAWAREYPSGDRGGESSQFLDLAHYLAHYQQSHFDALQRQRQHASRMQMLPGAVSNRGSRYHHDDDDNDALSMLIRHRSPAPYNPTSSDDRNTTTTPPFTPDNNELGRFVGRRSGMVLVSPVSAGSVGRSVAVVGSDGDDHNSHTTPLKGTMKTSALRHFGSDNIAGGDDITTLPITSALTTTPRPSPTPTPKRMSNWDETWDEDVSQSISIQHMTPILTSTPRAATKTTPRAASQNKYLQADQELSSGSSNSNNNNNDATHGEEDDDGELRLPLPRDSHRAGNDALENEGSTDADSFDSNKGGGDAGVGRSKDSSRGVTAGLSPPQSPQQAAQVVNKHEGGLGVDEGCGGETDAGRVATTNKKGWVVWNLQGSDDKEHLLSSSSSSSSSSHDHNSSSSSSSSGGGGNSSSNSNSSSGGDSSFPFTAEQAFLFAELLYILRPVV